jgi:hypothetical protein
MKFGSAAQCIGRSISLAVEDECFGRNVFPVTTRRNINGFVC